MKRLQHPYFLLRRELSRCRCGGRPRYLGTTGGDLAMRKAIREKIAPRTVTLIQQDGDVPHDASVFIRSIGCTRRVFLLDPYLTANEMEGLAYRIKVLSKNEGINSILFATDGTDDKANGCMPAMLLERDNPYYDTLPVEDPFGDPNKDPNQSYFVAGGYDPVELYKSGKYCNYDEIRKLLTHLPSLASSIKGDNMTTKIPTISIPHGAITDGGFCYLLASYAIATNETTFRILNPSRGLTFDPVGLSYFLPRLGKDYRQAAANFPGCGIILATMGYEANYDDLIETGLATHYVDSVEGLGLLEHTLSELPPWGQQGLLKMPKRMYNDPEPTFDHNMSFRNIQVADTIMCFTTGSASPGQDLWNYDDEYDFDFNDPSLEDDPIPCYEARESNLVNCAALLNSIFSAKSNLVDILDGLKEKAASSSSSSMQDEESSPMDVRMAKEFVERLERQSPLAVMVTYRLLQLGSQAHEQLQSCVLREQRAQANLFLDSPDFANWAEHASTGRPFAGWKYSSIRDVPTDEVEEIIEKVPSSS